jgi:hypothetical protein
MNWLDAIFAYQQVATCAKRREMNWLDAIFIVLLVLGAIRGLLTGKMLSLLIIFAIWVISIAIAVNFEEQLGDTFGDYHWYPLLAFFIILGVIQAIIYWSGIPDYHWYPLLAFFIILGVIQAIIYWSGIPVMLINSIGWRPPKEQGMVGAMLLSACITAIYCGLIWRILWEIAVAVTRTSGFTVEGSGAASTYYNGLAVAGRLRGEQAEIEDLTEDYNDEEGPPENEGRTKTESL